MMPTKYRKKPIVLEAMGPLTGDNSDQISEWCGGHEAPDLGPTSSPSTYSGALVIPTLEGPMLAGLGDFVLKGIAGEFYPCRSDIFAELYEAVPEVFAEFYEAARK